MPSVQDSETFRLHAPPPPLPPPPPGVHVTLGGGGEPASGVVELPGDDPSDPLPSLPLPLGDSPPDVPPSALVPAMCPPHATARMDAASPSAANA